MRISCLWASPLQCVQLLLQSASFLRPDARNDRRHYDGFDVSINQRRGCSSPEHQRGNIMLLFFLNKAFVFYYSVQALVGWIILLGIWRIGWTCICFWGFFPLRYPDVTPAKSLKELLNTKMTYFFFWNILKTKIHFEKCIKSGQRCVQVRWCSLFSVHPPTQKELNPVIRCFHMYLFFFFAPSPDHGSLWWRTEVISPAAYGATMPVQRRDATCAVQHERILWCILVITHSSLSMFLFVCQIGGVTWKKKKKKKPHKLSYDDPLYVHLNAAGICSICSRSPDWRWARCWATNVRGRCWSNISQTSQTAHYRHR